MGGCLLENRKMLKIPHLIPVILCSIFTLKFGILQISEHSAKLSWDTVRLSAACDIAGKYQAEGVYTWGHCRNHQPYYSPTLFRCQLHGTVRDERMVQR